MSFVLYARYNVRPEDIRAAGVKSKRERSQRRRRSVEEIKADLDAIAAEFERLHGKPLLSEESPDVRKPA
jgi:hypothetical protein